MFRICLFHRFHICDSKERKKDNLYSLMIAMKVSLLRSSGGTVLYLSSARTTTSLSLSVFLLLSLLCSCCCCCCCIALQLHPNVLLPLTAAAAADSLHPATALCSPSIDPSLIRHRYILKAKNSWYE